MRAEKRIKPDGTKIVLVPESVEEFMFLEVESKTILSHSHKFEGRIDVPKLRKDVLRCIRPVFRGWKKRVSPTWFVKRHLTKKEWKDLGRAIVSLGEGEPFKLEHRDILEFFRVKIRMNW